jgi:hypothetical protein
MVRRMVDFIVAMGDRIENGKYRTPLLGAERKSKSKTYQVFVLPSHLPAILTNLIYTVPFCTSTRALSIHTQQRSVRVLQE